MHVPDVLIGDDVAQVKIVSLGRISLIDRKQFVPLRLRPVDAASLVVVAGMLKLSTCVVRHHVGITKPALANTQFSTSWTMQLKARIAGGVHTGIVFLPRSECCSELAHAQTLKTICAVQPEAPQQ